MKSISSFLTLLLLAAQPALAQSDVPAKSDTTELAAVLALKGDPVQGKDAYELCRGCHRPDASGKPEAGYPQRAGQHPQVTSSNRCWMYAQAAVTATKCSIFIVEDVLPREQIAHIAAYLHSLPVPTTNGKGDGQQLELGKRLYERDCAVCHGQHGEGVGEKFYPRVAGQHYNYL